MITIIDRYKDIFLLKHASGLYCLEKINNSVGITLKASYNLQIVKDEFKKMKVEG